MKVNEVKPAAVYSLFYVKLIFIVHIYFFNVRKPGYISCVILPILYQFAEIKESRATTSLDIHIMRYTIRVYAI